LNLLCAPLGIPKLLNCHYGLEIFDAVQAMLNAHARRADPSIAKGAAPSPLTGRIFDADGQPMSPAFAYGRHGKLYRYYVSASLQQGHRRPKDDPDPRRVSAQLLDEVLARGVANHHSGGAHIHADTSISSSFERINRVTLLANRLIVLIRPEHQAGDADEPSRLVLPFQLSTKTGRSLIIPGDQDGPRRDSSLIRALRKAHAHMQRDASGKPILDAALGMIRARRILRLAFLAPDIQRARLSSTGAPPHPRASDRKRRSRAIYCLIR
jgi:site-specific DNA recombinase